MNATELIATMQDGPSHYDVKRESAAKIVNPQALKPAFNAIPKELQALDAWTLWKYNNGKKPPCTLSGQYQRGDMNAWELYTFDQVQDAMLFGDFDGVGLVLQGQRNEQGLYLAALDFDDLHTPDKYATAMRIINDAGCTYVETSPSGHGLRGWGWVGGDVGNKSDLDRYGLKFEAATNRKYFTVTGHPLPDRCTVGFMAGYEGLTGRGGTAANGNDYQPLSVDDPANKPITQQTIDDLAEPLARLAAAGYGASDSQWAHVRQCLQGGIRFDDGKWEPHLKGLWLGYSRQIPRYCEDTGLLLGHYDRPEDVALAESRWRARGGGKAHPNQIFTLATDEAGWVNTRKGASGAIDWPEPTPLPDALPPVAPFNSDLLPVALRAWVSDVAYRMQCPPDFPAVAAMVALSSLIGARAVIRPKELDDWQVVPNLWGMVVGRPGVKKSPALSVAMQPLGRLQTAEDERIKPEREAWAVDRQLAELCASHAKRDAATSLKTGGYSDARSILGAIKLPPVEPTARRFVVNDATVEKLGELLAVNEWGTLAFRDELYGLLTSLDKQGQEGSRAFYLTAYDGNQGYTFDRIGRGTVHIPRVCLSMIGGIQPGRLQEYVRGAVAGGGGDDGLLQRFGLAVWPDIAPDYTHTDILPDSAAKEAAWAIFERLAKLERGGVWRLSPQAQDAFVAWQVQLELELRGDSLHPAMASHLAKYRKLIPALALVFALIDTPDSGEVVGEAEMRRAVAWGDYLRTHANRIYAAAVTPEIGGAIALLAKLRTGASMDSFTPRQIAVKGWMGLGSPEAVRKAADLLADYDYLRREVTKSGPAGGRPSDCYLINPAVFRGGESGVM